ncbi:hypothetical protein B0I37DRAFT_106345 [Chaetomium sp. MPI-CAGE-AT-0009]|nr:hypothetical protein B0I37DRAFT_106345 [Chaetomium sp. MPI-CAGE-AT-0009]
MPAGVGSDHKARSRGLSTPMSRRRASRRLVSPSKPVTTPPKNTNDCLSSYPRHRRPRWNRDTRLLGFVSASFLFFSLLPSRGFVRRLAELHREMRTGPRPVFSLWGSLRLHCTAVCRGQPTITCLAVDGSFSVSPAEGSGRVGEEQKAKADDGDYSGRKWNRWARSISVLGFPETAFLFRFPAPAASWFLSTSPLSVCPWWKIEAVPSFNVTSTHQDSSCVSMPGDELAGERERRVFGNRKLGGQGMKGSRHLTCIISSTDAAARTGAPFPGGGSSSGFLADARLRGGTGGTEARKLSKTVRGGDENRLSTGQARGTRHEGRRAGLCPSPLSLARPFPQWGFDEPRSRGTGLHTCGAFQSA